MYGYRAPVTSRGASSPAAAAMSAPMPRAVAPPAPSAQPAPAPVTPIGSSMTQITPAALLGASAIMCYLDVSYSSLLFLLGAAALAYAVYANGLSSISWWVWAVAALALYMYSVGPCHSQFGSDYESAAAMLGY